MNSNTQRIVNLIENEKLNSIEENLNPDGSVNWSFVEADVYSEVNEDDDDVLSIKLISDDIDSAFEWLDIS